MTIGVDEVASFMMRVEGVQVVRIASSFMPASSLALSLMFARAVATLNDEVVALDVTLVAQSLNERLIEGITVI